MAGGAGPADAFGHIWARRKDPRLVHADLGLNQGDLRIVTPAAASNGVSRGSRAGSRRSQSADRKWQKWGIRGAGGRKWKGRTCSSADPFMLCFYGPTPHGKTHFSTSVATGWWGEG